MIENHGGTIVITGTQDINLARVLTLRKALELEIKGLKLSRGMSAATIIKREFGWKGNNVKLLDKLNTHIEGLKRV